MSNLMSYDFEGEGESEDEEFNPTAEVGSDDEDAGKAAKGPARRESSAEAPEQDVKEAPAVEEADQPERAATDGARSRWQSDGRAADDAKDEVDGADGEADGQDEDEDEADKGEGEDDEEDEDDDDEDDEDEEDAVANRPRKRRKRDARLQFIDVEAEVDEEEDEELDEDDELVGDEPHPDDALELPAGAERDDRRHRELDRQRELEASMDAEKQAAALKERYGRNRVSATTSAVVPQRLLLPSVDDPTIWGVKVKPGKEREVVFAILKRWEDRINTREPIQICSAFEREKGMSGYVYIEARRQADVMPAIENIQHCYARTPPILVPIAEMPDLLRVRKSKQLQRGDYVRITRGHYAGDLALVEDVESNGIAVTLRVVPRLDYGANEDVNAEKNADTSKRKRPGAATKGKVRPPPRLFSEVEAKKKHSRFLSQISTLNRNEWKYYQDNYSDGFLIKEFKMNHLQTENVNPTLEEATRFSIAEDGVENLDLATLAATINASKSGAEYLPGDMVEIYDGEQQGVCGKAVSVHQDIVSLRVTEGDLTGQVIEAPVKSLRKKFRDGDHVKVIGGSKYRDEVGMVIRVRDDRVTLITDSTSQEITVFSKDLREASDSGGMVGDSKYDLYDLVQLDAATVACVVKVDRESLRVLTQDGSVRTLLPSNISAKLERRRHAVATDRDGSEIRHDDTVKEHGGEQKQGYVLHIHRTYLFVRNRQQAENAGVFVVRSGNVTTVAAKGGRVNNAGPDLSKMNPAMQRNGGANATPGQMAPPKTFGRDQFLGKNVTIRKGPYKGLLGIVKDATDDSARVELHSKNKIVTVKKDMLTVRDQNNNPIVVGGFGSRRPGQFGATPSRVPSAYDGGRTPLPGSKTPMGDGGRTPMWNRSIAENPARTPMWARNTGREGGMTAYGGSQTAYGGQSGGASVWGGATAYGGNVWSASAKTPLHASHGTPSDPYGSKTPLYRPEQAPTPGAHGDMTPHHGVWSAPTPGGYDAPTPGFHAPTPGGPGNHPTPGSYGGGYGAGGQYATPAAAPTPGGYPETPGYYGAPETPAAPVGDEDPRYE
ncbi:hypothetical protein W97_01853 [Coniosporium apollinis CBS 100218]|uniref:Transcription elongation factor SPT5 n=1 Tax=Coniosporium apollinis (strain CBS 100218) TaxID=1168221 RepID=R7YLF6_CONA1|nr:uncharacterized protein W97_01853 [Coniosporium apollinis CBS 100218]EON62629.1 hypothetical protein W97_01853 [Coniosporium apollinis CBS 100218]